MYLKNSFIFLIILVVSCQPIETISPVKFDNSNFEKISINAKELSINISYNSIYSEDNIEDQVKDPPVKLIKSWANDNINYFGNENKFIINILDASIFKREIENKDAKKYEEKTVFQYETFFLVNYELYDDSDYLLSNTTVEVSRSTTSQKYISLNEVDLIINDLLNKALKDFVKESKSMIKEYMAEYIQ